MKSDPIHPHNRPTKSIRSGSSSRSGSPSIIPFVIAILLLAVSLVLRLSYLDVVTSDMQFYVLRWYRKFQELGIGLGLGRDFYNYSPPYMYLLALSTLTADFISPVIAVKAISTAFDIFSAFMIYKIIRLKYPDGYLPHLGAAIFFCAPTVIANTAIWGQADSTYISFLLVCIYCLLINRPLPSVFFYAVAFAFKPQAIFLAPILLLWTLWKKLPWYYLLMIPMVYIVASLPVIALGRTWHEILAIYLSRPVSGKALTHNAPSMYVFIPRTALDWLAGPGVLIGVAIVTVWLIAAWRRHAHVDPPGLLLSSLISLTLMPFVLPNMHDRYFYPSDVLSIVFAFFVPEMWFIPILYQLISGLSYSIYLLSATQVNLEAAAIINLFTLSILLIKQVSMSRTIDG